MKNLLFSLSLIFVLLTSCKTEEELQVNSISFDSTQVQVNIGESVTLTVTQTPANLPVLTYSWISLSPSIATVENGIVKGISEGTTQVRVTSLTNQSLTDECTIVVRMLGTSDNPYLIKNIADLISMRDNINNNNAIYGNKSYKLMSDLDFINEQSWIPIGTTFNAFTGIFNGNGKTIKNIRIGTSTSQVFENGGLFGRIDGGEIINLGIHWSILNSRSYTGALCGELHGGTIINCYSTGQILSSQIVGGIVGELKNGTITNCYSSCSITANNTANAAIYNGGIVGKSNDLVNEGGLVSNCIALNSSLISINSNSYPNRIANFFYPETAINNYASASMVVQKGSSIDNLTTKTSFTNVKNDGLNLTGNPIDLLNAYVLTNPNYNGVKLNKWKVQQGLNNGNPIFE